MRKEDRSQGETVILECGCDQVGSQIPVNVHGPSRSARMILKASRSHVDLLPRTGDDDKHHIF